MSKAVEKHQFGADLVEVSPCDHHLPGAGQLRSAYLVTVNGTARAYLYVKQGYGSCWTVGPVVGSRWSDPGTWRAQHYATHLTGKEGKRDALAHVVAHLHERYPLEVELKARRAAERERDRAWNAKRNAEYRAQAIARFPDVLAHRLELEESAEALASITAAGLSNLQAAALNTAQQRAHRAVAMLHDVEGEERRRREFYEKGVARAEALKRKSMGFQ